MPATSDPAETSALKYMDKDTDVPPNVPATSTMLRELADGAAKILENAADLYAEASTLYAAGALSRALFLHQISLEECAKVEMLGAWAVSVLMGFEGDRRKLTVAFASHKAKNYTNAYLLPPSEAEKDARRERRWNEAAEVFKAQQAEFHRESNSAKNASLYVDMQHGVFTAPSERITKAMVENIARANEEFLSGADVKDKMVKRWVANPEKVEDMLKWFATRLEECMSESDDPEQALRTMLDEMLSHANQTGYAEAMRKRDTALDAATAQTETRPES